MHSVESRLVRGPSNILFAGVYMCTFQPGNVTGWGSERVNNINCDNQVEFLFFISVT